MRACLFKKNWVRPSDGTQQWVGGVDGKSYIFLCVGQLVSGWVPLWFHPPPPLGVGQVLWMPAKSGCVPFSFCPPPPRSLPLLLKKKRPWLWLPFIQPTRDGKGCRVHGTLRNSISGRSEQENDLPLSSMRHSPALTRWYLLPQALHDIAVFRAVVVGHNITRVLPTETTCTVPAMHAQSAALPSRISASQWR